MDGSENRQVTMGLSIDGNDGSEHTEMQNLFFLRIHRADPSRE
jgi:hypothetical protein